MVIDIPSVQAFHGHMCPGLATGIRVSEQALREMGPRPGDEEVVAVVETDNCAVDAIQFLTRCTFGKGNLIHLDYGKNAFRFFRRSDGKAIRIRVRSEDKCPHQAEEDRLREHARTGKAGGAERMEAAALRARRIEWILSAPLADLVEVQPIEASRPPRARIFNSIACAQCGERTMETRLRMLEGKALCPECFEQAVLRGK
ncbi:MAG: TraR/DksA C4-type zinc finger protein [Anaerolineales bacterium]|nr:TraR/DksA C4-type zinc finger protein [Anaerolineales bacterium]